MSESISGTSESARVSLKTSDVDAVLSSGRQHKQSEKVGIDRKQNNIYRLTVQDILISLGKLRVAAGIDSVILLVDEFSSLNLDLQLRFTTLLRKILGNQAGVFVKLAAITDNYTLGSSIILQRDLFELSLDLDTFVKRHGSLGDAMEGLRDLAASLVDTRLKVFNAPSVDDLFHDQNLAFDILSKSAMGVPRTIGIVLKEAWNRAVTQSRTRILKPDLEYGVKYASEAYFKQLIGSCGVAIPQFNKDIFDALLQRAKKERPKADTNVASHFLASSSHELKLKWLNMFFLIHLIESGRASLKDKDARNLYAFDFGVCMENNFRYSTDSNVIRLSRFVYDDVFEAFDDYFKREKEAEFRCNTCGKVYVESELLIGGKNLLSFCPADKGDLTPLGARDPNSSKYTEEETKIVGAIRSASEEDELIARRVADDVGCYVQKVSKFAEKLDKAALIRRKQDKDNQKLIYFRNTED